MKLTEKAKKVLEAIERCPNGGGGRIVAQAMGIYCGRTTGYVAGAYAGKLVRSGWLHKEDEWYTNSRGGQSFMGVRYWVSDEGRRLIAGKQEAKHG
jgi:hypothetical protein